MMTKWHYRTTGIHAVFCSVFLLTGTARYGLAERAEGHEPAAATIELRLTNYNIRYGRGMDNAVDLERTARVLRDTRPDLTALQEVDVGTRRTEKIDQAAQLGELTDKLSLFGKAIDFQGGAYGNAVLSRFPIIGSKTIALPSPAGGERRAAVFATVKHPGLDKPFVFGSFHLCSRSAANRLAQIQRMIDYVRELDLPVILAGDLNAEPDTKEYRLATSFFSDLISESREGTYPSANPTRRIDYFLFHPGDRFKRLDYHVIPEKTASDHRPLRMTVQLAPP